jgi:hypothetical protein
VIAETLIVMGVADAARYAVSAALLAVTLQVAALLGAVSVVPEMTQPPEATEKVTAPLPLPPVVLKVLVWPVLSAVLVAATTSVV